jgi:3-methyladenine DNA glycosylase AlkD
MCFVNSITKEIRKELLKHTDLEYKKGSVRFFIEKINPLGVRTPMVRKIAKQYFVEIKDKKKIEIFNLCEELLERRTMEETTIAFQWVRMIEKDLKGKDFSRFERWLKTYVNNWAFCDDFCTHAFGYVITHNPELLKRVEKWRTSKNRWLRRASAVILIHIMHSRVLDTKQKRAFLKPIFETARTLMHDEDDLVQKGYGWMLKEASNIFPADVFRFVIQYKEVMPRTALRYAVERYPEEMRHEAMS